MIYFDGITRCPRLVVFARRSCRREGGVRPARRVGTLVAMLTRRLDLESNRVMVSDNEVRGRSGDRDQPAMEGRVTAVANQDQILEVVRAAEDARQDVME